MSTSSSLTAWTTACGIRFPSGAALAQKVTTKTPSSASAAAAAGKPLPVRGVFTERRIARGNIVAVVPPSAIVTPFAATQFLQSSVGLSSAVARSAVGCANVFASPKVASSLSSAAAWFSRDQLLVVASLAYWRWLCERQQQQQHPCWSPRFDPYLSALPRRQPPLALTFAQRRQHNDGQQPLIDRFATPLDPHPRGGVKPKLGVPTASINPNESVIGTMHLTTEQQLGELEHAVHRAAQRFVEGLTAAPQASSLLAESDADRFRELFEWAHFIVRSRAVCPTFMSSQHRHVHARKSTFERDESNEIRLGASADGAGGSGGGGGAAGTGVFVAEPRLIPFVDMLNHSMVRANVTACWNRGTESLLSPGGGGGGGKESDGADEEVLVTATRDIEPGEELLMNYADHQVRGQFMFAPRIVDANDSGGGGDSASSRNLEPLRQLVRAQRAAGVCEDALSFRWQFGFELPAEELQHTRELMWARSLKGRIRRMMDVRRRGRPGEFVVGVPEGLAALRQQRERVEKSLYSGRRVFPVESE